MQSMILSFAATKISQKPLEKDKTSDQGKPSRNRTFFGAGMEKGAGEAGLVPPFFSGGRRMGNILVSRLLVPNYLRHGSDIETVRKTGKNRPPYTKSHRDRAKTGSRKIRGSEGQRNPMCSGCRDGKCGGWRSAEDNHIEKLVFYLRENLGSLEFSKWRGRREEICLGRTVWFHSYIVRKTLSVKLWIEKDREVWGRGGRTCFISPRRRQIWGRTVLHWGWKGTRDRKWGVTATYR